MEKANESGNQARSWVGITVKFGLEVRKMNGAVGLRGAGVVEMVVSNGFKSVRHGKILLE